MATTAGIAAAVALIGARSPPRSCPRAPARRTWPGPRCRSPSPPDPTAGLATASVYVVDACCDDARPMLELAGQPLLGRARELELLVSFLDGIETSGQALMLRGAPGIGKSRLLAEAAARRAHGA